MPKPDLVGKHSKKSEHRKRNRTVQIRIHAAAMRVFAERKLTDISVSELSQAAGVTRATIYNNLADPDSLFESVAAELAREMNRRVAATVKAKSDPAERLSCGIRLYVRRAHEDVLWGNFISRFALNHASLQELWSGPPIDDLREGMRQLRYSFPAEQLPSAVALIAGAVVGAISLVDQGYRGWRDAGSEAAELVLVALGITRDEARRLSTADLPTLEM